MNPIIIIGTGLAGYTVASEYRKLDATREILIFSSDDGRQYAKPILSNAMAQNKTAEQLTSTCAADMAQRLNATVLIQQTVLAIDPATKTVTTGQDTFTYGDLVLALGADAIKLPIAGDGARDVISVNDLADYARLRATLNGVERVLIMGAGLIGCEFANDLLHAGIVPIVVDPNLYPIAALAPAAVGIALRNDLEIAGVCWQLGTKVERIESTGSGYEVTLLGGTVLAVNAVMSAVGLMPRVALAQAAGMATRKGILVDGYGQTSVARTYALGDCAEYGDGMLMPYVRPTLIAARSIAATLAGSLTRIDFPAMPIMVKTPAHPVVVQPPRADVVGNWLPSAQSGGQQWLFKDVDERLHGFVVSGARAKTHGQLSKMMGGFLPEGGAE